MMLLEGKVALVVGAGRGLGRACAQTFAREGAKVVVADINAIDGHESVALVRDAGGEARFVEADISKMVDVQRMVRTAVESYGGLHCAINNAVLSLGRPLLADLAEADFERAMSVNLAGIFMCMKYEIQTMLGGGGGAIVNIGSGNEHSANAGLSWYLSAKQGIYGMTKCAALEYGGKGIRVNAVGPGAMWSPSLRESAMTIPQHIERMAAGNPLGRIGEPQEVAEAAVWLCSPRASFILGQTLVADGGASLNF